MKRVDPELAALLERGKTIRRLPDIVRARALARARATMAAGATFAPEAAPTAPTRGRWRRAAIAATICLAAGSAVAGAALRLRGRGSPPVDSTPLSSPPAPPVARFSTARPLPTLPILPTDAQQPTSIAKSRRSGGPANAHESYAAELKLLKHAQAACAAGDFQGALVLVAEHAREFPRGRLAEDREALRVRSLAGSGRTDEARRAGAAFAHRFPRSVLLPRLRETVRATE